MYVHTYIFDVRYWQNSAVSTAICTLNSTLTHDRFVACIVWLCNAKIYNIIVQRYICTYVCVACVYACEMPFLQPQSVNAIILSLHAHNNLICDYVLLWSKNKSFKQGPEYAIHCYYKGKIDE